MAWTEAEAHLAVLLALIMRAETDTTIAVFQTIRRSTVKHDAIEQAATNAFVKEDVDLIKALLLYAKTVEKERNNLAHGYWGISSEIQDGLAWISQELMTLAHVKFYGSDLIDLPVSNIEFVKQGEKTRNATYIYRLKDLEDIRDELDIFIRILQTFNLHIARIEKKGKFELNVASRTLLSSPAPIRERLVVIRRREDQRNLGSSSLEPSIFDLL